MRRSVSVIVPVKDGERYLAELLLAVRGQADDAASLEILVIDSGSRDRSLEIARAEGAEVLEIPPEEFGHGRTRNLGAERTSGEILVFLTQDATPLPGWLAALQEAFELDPRVGAVYGPHRPRPDTSPMIARELEAFFAGHAPDGRPVVQRAGDEPYLSNVNAAYARDCWDEIRFPDVPYSEDQAFARSMPRHGWAKVFHPGAAVLHAHDYPPVDFMRRYFDEYRGLRETIGHTEPFRARSLARDVRAMVSGDVAWMRDREMPRAERARWTARSVVHHGGRKIFSALGSRAHTLPAGVQRRLSLEGSASTVAPPRPPELPGAAPRGVPQPATAPWWDDEILHLAREGAAPLLDPVPGMADAAQLHIAVVIPPFRRGSGGHNSIFQMLSRLEQAGHVVTVWLHDPMGWQAGEWPAVVAENISEWFAPLRAPVFKSFAGWYGADVVLATGWQTVYPVMRLPDCRARAYLVHDHESEFYATSAEARWAEQTYGFGMHAIAASPWLADLVRDRYGGTASEFEFGVDHAIYHPRDVARRRDTVIFYAREVTPRRAVPLGMLALEELRRRRPDLRIVLFGDSKPNKSPVPYEHLGIASPDELALAYSEATVGLCLSMTNYSLIPQEMLACGLPCVDLAGFSAESVFGADGPVELVPFDPVELADAIERLLLDTDAWERRSDAGIRFVAGRTWDRAAEQVETGIREAMRLRELGEAPARRDPTPVVAVIEPGAEWSARSVEAEPPSDHPATDRIYARLAPEDIDAIDAALSPEEAWWVESAPDEGVRRHTRLALGVWHQVPEVLEKTGLRPDEPPAEVHAMARGPLAAGGDLYSADMLVAALQASGGDMAAVRRGLDFGCSSGRALRALAAAWPDVEWHGADPNEGAIAWAREHVPGVRFERSTTEPPLPYGDGSFDLVTAISIWSHFDEGPARDWLAEMHRLITPGGHLAMTVHGLQSIAHYAAIGERSAAQLERIRRALYRRGFWFAAEFGDAGDHGVVHPGWGTAFLSPEWLLRATTGAWDVVHFAVGRNSGNQDLVVLRRRTG